MPDKLTIGFLGAGKMATALARGFIHAGLIKASYLLASDPIEATRTAFSKETGARTTASNSELVHFSSIIFIAVKPANVATLLSEIRENVREQHLIISIAAGVTLETLESALKPGVPVIRVMPNTPALVGAGASAYALGKFAKQADGEIAEKFLSAIGIAVHVKESLLDAVTGLSGSGPAYVYMMIEALSDGGVSCGLPRDLSTKLAAQTVLGSAKMVLETGLHPGALKDMVTSPAGTTIEGVHELEIAGVRGAFMNAVRAATAKSQKRI